MFWLLFIFAIVLIVFYLWDKSNDEVLSKPRVRDGRGARVPIDLPECRAAVHEAGHAVAAWSCTLVSDIKHVVINRGGSGHIKCHYFDLKTTDARWCHLVILLAGAAAETMMYTRGRSRESLTDLEGALEHAKEIGSALPPWKMEAGPTFDFTKIFTPTPPEEVIGNLEEGYRMARRIVRLNESRLYRVVGVLLAKKNISHADLEPVLGHRLFTRLLLPFGPKFVLPHKKRVKS